MRAKFGVTNNKKKTKNHARVIFHPFVRTLRLGDRFEFCRVWSFADAIPRAKFCDNWFRGFGVLIPPILPFFIGIAGRPYNSVTTTVHGVLHCDSGLDINGVGGDNSTLQSESARSTCNYNCLVETEGSHVHYEFVNVFEMVPLADRVVRTLNMSPMAKCNSGNSDHILTTMLSDLQGYRYFIKWDLQQLRRFRQRVARFLCASAEILVELCERTDRKTNKQTGIQTKILRSPTSDVNKTYFVKTKTNIFQDQDFLVKTKAKLISRPRLYSDHCTGYDIMVTK